MMGLRNALLGIALGFASLTSASSPNERSCCLAHCRQVGPNPSKWLAYYSLDELAACDLSLLLDFSIFDKVDERTKEHGIRACILWGADWDNETTPKLHIRANETLEAGTHKLNATYHIGW